jgi:MFS family permease
VKRVPAWYPRHHFIPLSVMLGGLCVGLTAAAPGFWTAAPAIFFCGVFWMWTFNTSFASLQLLVEDRMRGRIFSIANVLSFGAMPMGALLAGWLGGRVVGGAQEGFQAQIGLAACAAVLTLAGAVMLTWRTPEIDGIQPGDPNYDRRPGFLRGLTASAHRRR